MKTHFLLIVLFSTFFMGEMRSEPRPRFFGVTEARGDADGKKYAVALNKHFIILVANKLKNSFPCAEVTFDSDIHDLLAHEYQLALLRGSDDDANLNRIAEQLGCDYLISLMVTVSNNQTTIMAVCLDNKKAKTMAMALESVVKGNSSLDAMERVAKKLVEQIEQYEICRFKGKVQLKVVTHLKKDEKEEYNVYCNEKDGIFKKTTSVDNYAEQNWDLEKVGLNAASGTVTYSINEQTVIEEENGCYRCPSGREGGRTYHNKTIATGKIEGLSKQVVVEGIAMPPIVDTRISLTFLDDDTYFIRIKAASELGFKDITSEEKAEGTCDNINKPGIPSKVGINTAINDPFGPFPGKAIDKTLNMTKEWKVIDPVTKEEKITTLTIDLSHD
jgi:hypothetical protein